MYGKSSSVMLCRDLQTLVARKAGVEEEHWVLDAGTGPDAFLAVRLAQLMGERGFVVAVDYEGLYASRIKDAIAESGLSGMISFVLADAEKKAY